MYGSHHQCAPYKKQHNATFETFSCVTFTIVSLCVSLLTTCQLLNSCFHTFNLNSIFLFHLPSGVLICCYFSILSDSTPAQQLLSFDTCYKLLAVFCFQECFLCCLVGPISPLHILHSLSSCPEQLSVVRLPKSPQQESRGSQRRVKDCVHLCRTSCCLKQSFSSVTFAVNNLNIYTIYIYIQCTVK